MREKTCFNKEISLYKVVFRGLYNSTFHESYVISDSLDSAYKVVREWLDKKEYGFSSDRELDHIDLIADNIVYDDIPILFLDEKRMFKMESDS
jgi:hypothetical protein